VNTEFKNLKLKTFHADKHSPILWKAFFSASHHKTVNHDQSRNPAVQHA
jgi:hypothetical protein